MFFDEHNIGPVRYAAVALAGLATLVVACGENQTPPPQLDDYEPGSVESLECTPDLNGRIEPDELRPAFDVPINFRVSPSGDERPVDLAGQQDRQGVRVWDLSSEDYGAADQRLELIATELGDQWYAGSYPDGDFSTVLDPALQLDAIYSYDGDTIYLHGYASQTEDPDIGQTLVAYEDPVVAYDFPIEEGDSWSSVGVVQDGTVRDLPYTAEESYEFEVDATGELWLPDLRFDQVLRVRTEVTVDPAIGNPIYRQQVQFLFECFGEVARLVGPDEELDGDFTRDDYIFDTAVEMRRLGF